ncbi:hypothetical protein AMS68_001525 [Peltaster fructicola]|uniref:Nucleolar protein 16 n=1 Tax=Peltaster fructicola TaxID=286661 RepID=A0A6H0XN17_9PEZI|nr:hypothetical protein AMS68_001525 [Peltaster fructicola]
MGRERQKRKNRSGLSRVRQRTKSKKTVLANPIIAANWDKSKTLSQNYKRLGLAVKLNKQTGGVEKDVSQIYSAGQNVSAQQGNKDSLKISNSAKLEAFGLGEAKVERDPHTGKIIRVVQSPHAVEKPNPLNDPLNDIDSESDGEAFDGFALDNQHGNVDHTKSASTKSLPSTSVVQQLEERASMSAPKHKRRQTENELAFIRSLVRKHGLDYSKMARDMKLNYMQRSEGDLKRRIKKWQENGGTVD